MDITRADSRPLRDQVAGKLRQLIESGELAPGDKLEPEDVLAERYRVSRHTVRQALNDLTMEGLLASGRGRGRVVRDYRPLEWRLSQYESRHLHEEAQSEGDQWSGAVRAQGRRPSEEIDVGIADPPDVVTKRLDLTGGELVVVRRRVRYADDVPYQLADSYFRLELIQDTPLMEPRSVSAPGGLLAAIGHPQARYLDEISIRMPTRAESAKLDLPSGTPVAEVVRTGYAEDGTALRVMISVAPGDRHKLIYETDAS
ncbi:MAG: GntR family transcriptional regulator [Streptosporangiaceae bacterium]